MTPITLFFTVDVDQDGIAQQNERDTLSWHSVAEVRRVAAVFHARGLPVTWFVRADNQLFDVYGTAAHLYERFSDVWLELEAAGDAFGWHPHLYERTSEGAWVADLDDVRCAAKLRRIHDDLSEHGRRFDVVRMGELRHGNALMHAVSELGLRVDCSATPGRARMDGERSYDWAPTPHRAYHPSRADYRVPGDPSLPIVELPLTMVDMQADYDPRPLPRYLATVYRHDLLLRAIGGLLDRLEREEVTYIHAVMHPEEVVPRQQPHGLYGFSVDTVARNVDAILEGLTRRNLRVAPTTVPRAADELERALAAEACH